eukprot:Gb_21829 [translate_table: standard]
MENPTMSWLRRKLKLKWPYESDREQKPKFQEEFNRRLKEVKALCRAVKANDIDDLQHVLCAMVLSECVYKRDTSEMLRAINKFKADFGGQLVNLKQVQPCLDHVPHRYILAEAGDTLFASFIGTKQYRDFVTDANILQGAVFHENINDNNIPSEDSEEASNGNQRGASHSGSQLGSNPDRLPTLQREAWKGGFKPAAHRGFLARAKGIPAVELYMLAQKRGQKLVLCGHSLGGAVSVLATLAILRAFPSSSLLKEGDRIQVKCITFSQPAVGNAALRDYVHRNGWQCHFRTYCIPEDVVPRILSPAYFQHYFAQVSEDDSQSSVFTSSSTHAAKESVEEAARPLKPKPSKGERLVLGLGPVQNSLNRLSRLVPIVGVQKQLAWLRGRREEADLTTENSDSGSALGEDAAPQSLEIQERADGIAFTPLPDVEKNSSEVNRNISTAGSKETRSGESVQWRIVPTYVPFGQLYLLAKASVEPLSASEYTKLTSVQSVLTELRELFQSHSMKSYRSRFQKIYELCTCDNSASIVSTEQSPALPHLQKWIGLTAASVVEFGKIAEPLIIRTATSIVPLGWSGVPGNKSGSEPLRVDVHGYGLHMCTLVQAQVNGHWCSTTVESLPLCPPISSYEAHLKLQKIRIEIGAPLKQGLLEQLYTTSIASGQATAEGLPAKSTSYLQDGVSFEAADSQLEGMSEMIIHCMSDFVTTSKKVYMRLRRIRLLGLEGAGKTSLYYALLRQARGTTNSRYEGILPNTEWQEGVAGGICVIDAAGVNLQDLPGEVTRLKHELSLGLGQLNKKIDLVILVHNLAHKIPCLHQAHASTHRRPALSLLLDEIEGAGVPWVLAITNKFAVSADQRKSAANAVMETYQVPSNMAVVINSCAYAVKGTENESHAWNSGEINSKEPPGNNRIQEAAQRFISAPMSLVQIPFRKKEVVLPVEGVDILRKLIYKMLIVFEDSAFQELARERLLVKVPREQSLAAGVLRHLQNKTDSATVAAATVGAGLGIIAALVIGAASAFRKP